ncbi:cadmium-translocating P-type ATPase [Cohnella sp. CBP 2801]|uniref:P-type Cu(+) transporter n=2 Tax=Cohnella zeiphila TaxID=2761120 RepID=A0A7X0VX22_9BACL|nr:cadmium-translocating P-type ATPase [Cohnella zeiphila]
METVRLQITGMTCAACSARIERTVAKLPGVARVTVSLPYAQAQVELDPRIVQTRQVIGRIRDIGYGAKDEPEDAASFNRRESRGYFSRFVLSALLSLPLFWAMLTHLPYGWGVPAPDWIHSPWLQLAAATVLQFYVGYPFYRGAYHAVKSGAANMDVLVALSTSLAYFYSHHLLFASLGHSGHESHVHLYFDTIGMILTAVLLGKWLETMAKGRALAAMSGLQRLQPRMIRVWRGGEETWIPLEELRVGDTAVVLPKERVSADGVVLDGRTEVDESFLTGEGRLAARAKGDRVYGGSYNLGGSIRVRVTAKAADSRLAGMIRLVEQAQHAKPAIQRRVDRISALLVPLMIGCAAATYALWAWRFAPGDYGQATRYAMAVLLVSCPCALGLAAPISILIASAVSARRGILFKEGRFIEGLPRIDRFLLDKTGTLTEGKPSLQAIETAGLPENYALRWAAALEKKSEHPLAKAIVAAAGKRGLIVPEAADTVERIGQGVAGTVEGRRIALGSAAWLRSAGVRPGPWERRAETADGRTRLQLARDGFWIGELVLEDRLKPESARAVGRLRTYGDVMMVTGDEGGAAARTAAAAGIGIVRANLMPEQKLELVRSLQAEGRKVAMIGDGVNDAAALAAADVGLVMDSGTDAAMQAGDVILTDGRLTRAAEAVALSRATMRNIRQNLGFSFLYNAVSIPLAAAGLLDPKAACLLMALSSLLVVGNSLRLMGQLGGRKEPSDDAVS